MDKTRPVIVCCNDYLCDMSPRAAHRLTHLGFDKVYDHVPGKQDWMAAGLPREGHSARIPNPGDVAQPDVPTCHFKASAADALGDGAPHLLVRDASCLGGAVDVAVEFRPRPEYGLVEPLLSACDGNFPQAFSHIGLINAAYAIAEAEQGSSG